MKKLLMILTLTAAGVMLAAASVKTDYAHSVNFSRFKTYSWLKVEAGDSLMARSHPKGCGRRIIRKGLAKRPVRRRCLYCGGWFR